MLHNVSTVDGKVTADERERLAATHGAARAAEIIAEVEAPWATAPADDPPSPRLRRGKPTDPTPTSETEE